MLHALVFVNEVNLSIIFLLIIPSYNVSYKAMKCLNLKASVVESSGS